MQLNASTMSFGVLVLAVIGVVSCAARPHISDSAFADLTAGDSDNSLVPRGADPNHMMSPEDNAMASLQMQLLQQYFNNLRMGASMDQMLRAPVDKRQVRYRQCYFNPISCFRK